MRVVVRGAGVAVDEPLRDRVERRVGSVFGRFGPKVERVTVRLAHRADSAVPGVRCAVSIALAAGSVKVEDSGDEPFEAAARAIERAGRALCREVERRETERRGAVS